MESTIFENTLEAFSDLYADCFVAEHGAESLSSVIDIGEVSTDTGASYNGGTTVISMANPANKDGIIDTVKLLFRSDGADAEDVDIATVTHLGSNVFVGRDHVVIPSVTRGSIQTFSGLSIQVKAGDYIGIYWPTSGSYLTGPSTSGAGIRWYSGNSLMSQVTYKATPSTVLKSRMNLCGEGMSS